MDAFLWRHVLGYSMVFSVSVTMHAMHAMHFSEFQHQQDISNAEHRSETQSWFGSVTCPSPDKDRSRGALHRP